MPIKRVGEDAQEQAREMVETIGHFLLIDDRGSAIATVVPILARLQEAEAQAEKFRYTSDQAGRRMEGEGMRHTKYHTFVSSVPARINAPCVYCLQPENHPAHIFGSFRFVGWHAKFEWKPADLWIGAYWKRIGNCVDLWLCLLPCIPLHLSWWWTREPLADPPSPEGRE